MAVHDLLYRHVKGACKVLIKPSLVALNPKYKNKRHTLRKDSRRLVVKVACSYRACHDGNDFNIKGRKLQLQCMGNSINGRFTSVVHAYICVTVCQIVFLIIVSKCKVQFLLTVICPRTDASNRTDKDHSAAGSNQKRRESLGCLEEAKDIDVEYLSGDVDVDI